MTYAAIMVRVQPEEVAQPNLDCAASLAAAFDTTLIGLGVEMIPPLASGGYVAGVSAEPLDALQAGIDKSIAEAKRRFDAAGAGLAKPTIWKSGTDMPYDRADAEIRTSDVVEALGGHGVPADTKIIDASHDAGQAILGGARAMAADLIVVGAYGHSQLGEWVFGGVTRELLDQHEFQVLFGH